MFSGNGSFIEHLGEYCESESFQPDTKINVIITLTDKTSYSVEINNCDLDEILEGRLKFIEVKDKFFVNVSNIISISVED